MTRLVVVVLALIGFGGCSGSGSVHSADSAEELREGLVDAGDCDIVRLEANVGGAFVVPAGVTLSGADGVTITVQDGIAIRLAGGTGRCPTIVRQLRVRAEAGAGIIAEGPGTVRILDVAVESGADVALGASGVDSLDLEQLEVRAGVRPVGPSGPAHDGRYGMVLVDVARADATDLSVSGFRDANVVVARSEGHEGEVVARFERTELSDGGGDGLVALGGVRVESEGLTAVSHAGHGLLIDGGSCAHSHLALRGNELGGAWLQRSTEGCAFTDVMVEDNRVVGIAALQSATVTVERGTIDATRLGNLGTQELGDGMQFVATLNDVVVRGLTLANNERVGMLFDGDGLDDDTLTLEEVSVDGVDMQLGCLDQDGAFDDDWDVGVTKLGVTEENDEAFEMAEMPLPTVGIIAPMMLPARGIVRDGLSDLID